MAHSTNNNHGHNGGREERGREGKRRGEGKGGGEERGREGERRGEGRGRGEGKEGREEREGRRGKEEREGKIFVPRFPIYGSISECSFYKLHVYRRHTQLTITNSSM